MANELYFFTQPETAAVQITLDTGQVIPAEKGTYKGRSDGNLMRIPMDVTGTLGSSLKITQTDGTVTFENRGLLITSQTGEALFALDDVRYVAEVVPVPPEPIKPVETDPLSLIQAVYATGEHDLSTKEGCGQFVEACCTSLHENNNAGWMHDKRVPPQNSYNSHAVDAIQCIAGQYYGMWDIIHSSVSPDAAPCFNLAGPPNPQNACYPAGACGQTY